MMRKILFLVILSALMMTGCTAPQAGETQATPSIGIELTRYTTATLTPTVTSTPVNAPTATLAPTQTPTPRAYTVKEKDTMGVIAYRNGITLDELKAANPGVDPYMLKVGMTLYIPAPSSVSTTPQAPTPTPIPLGISNVSCLPITTGGSTCFAILTNNQETDLESISAEFRLVNPITGDVLTRPATLPVSRLKAGSSAAVFAYFAPPVFQSPNVSLQLMTALQAGSASSGRPSASAVSPTIAIAENGSSALVSGEVTLDAGSSDAGTAWVTAAAFDASGSVIGVRRVELTGGVKAGESVPFSMTGYSLAGKIARVEVYVDAIP